MFTSQVCKLECDRLSADTVIVRRHKMDLGDGWVLWTEDESPPKGWTHFAVVKLKSTMKQWSVVDRPGVGFGSPGLLGSAKAWRNKHSADEGFAYKVPE